MTQRNYEHRTFKPATAADIKAFEAANGVTFCADYKTFLKTDGGLVIESDIDEDWEDEWIYQVFRFYGLHANEYLILNAETYTHFFDPKFLPICYPIGSDPGGNLLVQIAAGERKGHLAMLDHEVYYGGMEALIGVVDGHYPDDENDTVAFDSFENATPDEILDECFKQGFLEHYETKLKKHLTLLDKLYDPDVKNPKKPKPKETAPSSVNMQSLCRFVTGDANVDDRMYSSERAHDFVLPEDAIIGWALWLNGPEDAEYAIDFTMLAPDGSVLKEGRVITDDANPAVFKFDLRTLDGPPQPGMYVVHFSFPNAPAVEPVNYQGSIVFRARKYPFLYTERWPATDDQIADVETRFGLTLCETYKAYLKEMNGYTPYVAHRSVPGEVYDWEQYDRRSDLTDKHFAAYPFRTTCIFGLLPEQSGVNGEIYETEIVEELTNLPGSKIGHIAYSVARIYEVARLFQIAAGSRKGQLLRTLVPEPQLAAVATVRGGKGQRSGGKKSDKINYPFEDFKNASADEVIDCWLEQGLVTMHAETFEQAVARTMEADAALYEKLLDAFGDRSAPV